MRNFITWLYHRQINKKTFFQLLNVVEGTLKEDSGATMEDLKNCEVVIDLLIIANNEFKYI